MSGGVRTLPVLALLVVLLTACGGGSGADAGDGVFPETGPAYCWGDNESQGQLGDGTNTDRLNPTPVSGGLEFSQLSAGNGHTCGIAEDGSMYCWGDNESQGELGVGDNFDKLTPTQVNGEQFFVDVAAGGGHTCGLAIENAGTAYCWGDNEAQGQLGDGTNFDRLQPVAVSGNLQFTDLAAGGVHSCGIGQDGETYCWGSNYPGQGQLGIGNNNDQLTPTVVSGEHAFESVVAGGRHTCALTADGTAYCWGDNDGQGQLGTGDNDDRLVPAMVTGGHSFVDLAAGGAHTCGVTAEGEAYCWGNNHPGQGQLGVGDNNDRLEPTLVSTVDNFVAVVAGDQHTCGLTTDGDAYCWGDNYPGQGQLGVGDNNDRLKPELVSGGHRFIQLTAGGQHTCGIVDPSG